MAIDNPEVVDIVSLDSAGNVVLTVSDHLDWTDTERHPSMLQAKLNRYLAFVESGEILEACPEAKERPVMLKVLTLFEPDTSGAGFLERTRQAIEGAGFRFDRARRYPRRSLAAINSSMLISSVG
jgi:hypothetical protein